MSELKPCPKCNGDSFTARVCGGVAAFGCAEYVYEVECSCGLSFCVDCSSETKEEAEREGIEAWNNRVERTCNPIAKFNYDDTPWPTMVCSECGRRLHYDETKDGIEYSPYCVCGAKVVE